MYSKLKNTFGWFGAAKVLLGHLLKFKVISVGLKDFKTTIKFRPYTGDFATIRQVIWAEEYNLDLPNDPEYIIDLGANIGISSLALSHKFSKAKIIALEPDTKNFGLLNYNTRQFKDIIKLNNAIWIKNELVSLENPKEQTNSFIFKKTDKAGNTNTVQAITISSLMEKYNIKKINLLKVDIEAVEKELFLQGDNQWLNKVDFISIEFHDPKVEKAISELLKSMNFIESKKGEKRLYRNMLV